MTGGGLQALLDAHLPGFEARDDQRAMIAAVQDAVARGSDLCVEAGTGTGKTLAYLLPILASGKTAIIATATRQLQSQLLRHDVPVARAATGSTAVVAVLKGRSNYICLHRMAQTMQRHALTAPPGLLAVESAARTSATGDIAEVTDVAQDAPIWPHVTSTADNCLGSECPVYEDCFVVRARRAALAAGLLIVNHHLLLADYALRDRFDGALLLPAADVIVIDEAHALPDVASSFFGVTLSSRRCTNIVDDLHDLAAELGGEAGTVIGAVADDLLPAVRALFAAATGSAPREKVDGRMIAKLTPHRDLLVARCKAGFRALGQRHVISEGPAVARVRDSLSMLQTDVLLALGGDNTGSKGAGGKGAGSKGAGSDGAGSDVPMVRWLERRSRTAAFVAQPAETGPLLKRTLLAEPAARIFTSATLAFGADFSGFTRASGLDDDTVPCLRLAGGFDYPKQALLYLPRHLPIPFAEGRDAAVAREIERLVTTSGGGAMALFTSRRGMRDAHNRLARNLSITCLLQGEASKEQLLQRFVAEQPAVLFATMGFWQGVDLAGDVLRLVILDKVPFPPPDDPLFAARSERIQADGGSSFHHLSLPAAAISLRQGFGRLIRSHSDRGVVAILDPRLARMPYGRRLVAALPPARRTSVWAEVEAFFRGS